MDEDDGGSTEGSLEESSLLPALVASSECSDGSVTISWLSLPDESVVVAVGAAEDAAAASVVVDASSAAAAELFVSFDLTASVEVSSSEKEV